MRPAAAGVPILTYHSLDCSGSVISVAPAAFRRHMQLLARRGYQVLALGDLLEIWEAGQTPAGRPLVLTFDDGFRNTALEAAPLLDRLGFRATLFATSGHCGGTNDWPGQPAHIPRLPLLSLAELRALGQAGFEIGAHGVSHALLDRLPGDQVLDEVRDSRARLEQALGRPVRLFAYPGGRADQRARAAVRAHYRAACSTVLGLATPAQDRHFLPRIDSYYLRAPALFRLLGTGPGDLYLRLRALGRRLRTRLG